MWPPSRRRAAPEAARKTAHRGERPEEQASRPSPEQRLLLQGRGDNAGPGRVNLPCALTIRLMGMYAR